MTAVAAARDLSVRSTFNCKSINCDIVLLFKYINVEERMRDAIRPFHAELATFWT